MYRRCAVTDFYTPPCWREIRRGGAGRRSHTPKHPIAARAATCARGEPVQSRTSMTPGCLNSLTRPVLIRNPAQTRSARSCPDRRACTPRYAQHVLVADPARPRPLMAQPSHFPRARPRAPTREPSREPRMTLRNLRRAPPFTEGSLWRAGSTFCEQGLCEHFRESSPAHLTRASWARLSRP